MCMHGLSVNGYIKNIENSGCFLGGALLAEGRGGREIFHYGPFVLVTFYTMYMDSLFKTYLKISVCIELF